MYPKSFQKIINHFASLPSVGPKMAERLVLYLFKQDPEKLEEFAQDLSSFKKNLKTCQKCFNISEDKLCTICKEKNRDEKTICVVKDPLDVIAIEKTRRYQGVYHVLGGVLSYANQNQDKELHLQELKIRTEKEKPKEIIIATNPTTEGDATALYIKRMLSESPVKLTRLARGLSTGGDIEHADEITLVSALENRG